MYRIAKRGSRGQNAAHDAGPRDEPPPRSAAGEPALAELGFAPQVASDKLGVASATRMCRSVMIKGLKAMVIDWRLEADRILQKVKKP